MSDSTVLSHYTFLRDLGRANKTRRTIMLRFVTGQQMQALAEVVRYILEARILLFPQDVLRLRERTRVLRQLIEPGLSLQRKRNSLLFFHDLVPRLLRIEYINRAVLLTTEL